MRRRLEFALIVVVLLCVPALTRISQRLDPVAPAPQASGLSRSCDAPPERIVLSSPSSMAEIVEADASGNTDALPERTVYRQAPSDEALVPSPVTSPPDSLRAPPAFRR